MRIKSARALSAALSAMLMLGCAHGPAEDGPMPEVPPGTSHLILLGTSSVLAEIDPCGCPGNPTGGFAKKATYLTLTRQSGIDPIVIDAGDLLFKGVELTGMDQQREAALARAELIIELLNSTGLDAFVPGETDLAAGWEFLIGLRDKAGFPFLAANLSRSDSGPAMDAFVVVEREGVKVGVFGLVSPELAAGSRPVRSGEIIIGDPVAAGRKAVADLKNQGIDFIVAVVHLSGPELQRLTKEVPGVSFVFSGHFFPQWELGRQNLNGVPVFHGNRDHKYLGRADIFLTPNKGEARRVVDFSDGSNVPSLRSRWDAANRELIRMEQAAGNVSPDDFYAGKPDQLASLRRLRQQRREAANGLSLILDRDHFIFNMAALDVTIGRSEEIEAEILPWRRKYAPETIPTPVESTPEAGDASPR